MEKVYGYFIPKDENYHLFHAALMHEARKVKDCMLIGCDYQEHGTTFNFNREISQEAIMESVAQLMS